jgi:hypothetical protein
MYDYEDFYEPSEFESNVEQLKDTLKSSVKQEIQDELERLRKENSELQEIKNTMSKYKNEQSAKMRELEQAKSNAIYTVRNERLAELIASVNPLLYQVGTKSTRGEKCDKCDSNRQIEYTTPLGRIAKEYCPCGDYQTTFIVEPVIATQLRINRYGDQKPPVQVWYRTERKLNSDDDYAFMCKDVNVYQEGVDLASLDRYKVWFEKEADCQKYCDWLNMNQK